METICLQTNLGDRRRLMTDRELLENILKEISSVKNTQDLMYIQLKEHGGILSALQHAAEVHKADIDNLTHQAANLAGGIKSIKQMQDEHTQQLTAIAEKVAVTKYR